jgi:hypothetical protein
MGASGAGGVQGLFAILERECAHLAGVGEHLQGLIGDLADGQVSRERLILESQDADHLVQHLAELSAFFGALARQTGPGGVDPAAALANISLAGLAARLAATGADEGPQPPALRAAGEYELF